MEPSDLIRKMRRADVVALDSPDSETKVGSILISPTSKSVIAEGYNGFIRGANKSKLPTTRPDKYKFFVHAEANLIANCGLNGIKTDGAVIVQTLSPCSNCIRLCFQAGIKEIYFRDTYRDFQDSIDMGDLEVKVIKIELTEFTKIELSARK